MIKSLLKEIRVLFTGWEILFRLVFSYGLIFGFFFYVTTNLWYSVVMGGVGMLFYFQVFSIPNKRLKTYQFHLSELMKYVTNMSFFLQTRNNVYHSMKNAKETVSRDIQKDIEKSFKIMQNEAVLNTEHFKKYNFPTLDQFHHHLKIKYDRGGDSHELFDKIQQDMLFELKKRDELYRKRKGFAANVYVLLSLVVAMFLILRVFVTYLWKIFLSYKVASLVIISTTFLFIMLILYFLQKKNTDISVRV